MKKSLPKKQAGGDNPKPYAGNALQAKSNRNKLSRKVSTHRSITSEYLYPKTNAKQAISAKGRPAQANENQGPMQTPRQQMKRSLKTPRLKTAVTSKKK